MAFVAIRGAAQDASVAVPAVRLAAPRPVAVRVTWGGGQPRAWSGTITLVDGAGATHPATEWRTLCTEPDAAALAHDEDGGIVVHQPRPLAVDGVEIEVPDVQGWRIVAAIGPAGAAAAARVDVAVADLLVHDVSQPLDGDGNRLLVQPAPGEQLRTTVDGGAAPWLPGQRMRITVSPMLTARVDQAAALELRLRLSSADDGAEVLAQAKPLAVQPEAAVDEAAAGARRATRFDPVRFDVALPPREGAWNADLEVVESSALGWTRPVAKRTLQFVTLAAERPPQDPSAWRVVYELDPGSPRLHERLRRLPGVDLSGVSLPQVPLPSLSRPSLPRLPHLPLPAVPLPTVPLPTVSNLTAMVPRLSGLLAAGHSRVEPHALGTMLRLPPAESQDVPAWEGIVIAGASPRLPHVVEIEYPSDQMARVAVAVLELDAAGGRVESRHCGGFMVSAHAGQPEMRVHRFVFWPATRHPVVLLANQSQDAPALVGHVRILAGPVRLPAAAAATGRAVHTILDTPGFADFGAAGDTATRVAAVARSAEALAAQGAAGALVVVHADGAAVWPSLCTRQAPRWGAGAAEGAVDAAMPDLLAAACRAYAREGLRLVPAISCSAPVPVLERELARGGAEAAGIACVGRDGRPRRTSPAGGTHYNVLDPRVQRAVEDLVRELAGRVRGAAAVGGLAIVLPHDGWLHLPGVAWGLDDATFARFRAAAGVEESTVDANRFAARAALVEGPLRERWLEWRAAEMARFHARLADIVAEHDDRWSLAIVPTTLCSEGWLADRMRPSLLPSAGGEAALREAGLDPVRSTAHRRVVFVAPHVDGGGGLADLGTLAAGNALVARAVAPVARRGIVVLERPLSLDVRSMVPHGPFGSARAPAPLRMVMPATGIDAGRPLAEAFAVADAEVVFDARLAVALPAARPADRAAIESMPAGSLLPVAGVSAPLAVRTSRGDATWVHVINAAKAPVRATLSVVGRPSDALDAGSGASIACRDGAVEVDLPPWGMRTLRLGGDASVTAARVDYDPTVAAAVAARVADLARRRDALERPEPLDVLDNPGFELGSATADGGRSGVAPTGWELVETRRGTLNVVSGAGGAGRAVAFASTNGLSTLRSNPFPPPASGRVSVAVRLRIREGDPQPPLRVALEGVRDDREYYRFAAVGGLTGGRPLTGEWQQFVLQVDDLPDAGLESLRARFDLLGPGAVEIDEVEVFDLAFAESERVKLARQIGALEAAVEAGDVGACLVALDGHWPRFLEAHVPVPAAPVPEPRAVAAPAPQKPAERTGVLDRMWRLWQ